MKCAKLHTVKTRPFSYYSSLDLQLSLIRRVSQKVKTSRLKNLQNLNTSAALSGLLLHSAAPPG
jgi:hypothetical protein